MLTIDFDCQKSQLSHYQKHLVLESLLPPNAPTLSNTIKKFISKDNFIFVLDDILPSCKPVSTIIADYTDCYDVWFAKAKMGSPLSRCHMNYFVIVSDTIIRMIPLYMHDCLNADFQAILSQLFENSKTKILLWVKGIESWY